MRNAPYSSILSLHSVLSSPLVSWADSGIVTPGVMRKGAGRRSDSILFTLPLPSNVKLGGELLQNASERVCILMRSEVAGVRRTSKI